MEKLPNIEVSLEVYCYMGGYEDILKTLRIEAENKAEAIEKVETFLDRVIAEATRDDIREYFKRIKEKLLSDLSQLADQDKIQWDVVDDYTPLPEITK